MVQVQPVVGRRARNRLERQRAFLASAKHIVATEGLGALTMQRLADELGCAIGTAYTYFHSKSALVADVQRDAIETLTESYLLFRARFDAEVADEAATSKVIAIAHLVGFGRFWVATFETFPEEARLLQLLMAEPAIQVIDDTDAYRVVPSAMRLLSHASHAIEVAGNEVGALRPGDAVDRTIRLAAALNGVLLLDRLARIDPDVFHSVRHAVDLINELLLGWGADADVLSAANDRIDALAVRGPLAPPLPAAGKEED